MADERKHKHLEFIQGVVNRLGADSFMLKRWSIGLVSALLGLSTLADREALAWFAYLPLLMFWFLDGYFLWQERLFRALYGQVRQKSDEDIDFSMETGLLAEESKPRYRCALCSKTVAGFHGVLFLLTSALVCWHKLS